MELGGIGGGSGGGGGAASGSEVGPTEDTVLALLELLVEPLLSPRSSSAAGKPPCPAQEVSVAKQVQAVVFLYDYYHRKRNPELEYLDFVSFCKLAVIFKPSLLTYMKVMQRADYSELVDLEKEFSLTEKMVIEACEISKGLNTSEDVVGRWPISKVAVFLVDHRKENCFLLHSSNTLGVWSVIEKENALDLRPESMTEEKRGTKKKRITKKPLKGSKSVDETGLQQLAFAAVKDACGCSQSDLKVLESHTVYSLNKEKTAARFYIIQCIESNNEPSDVRIRDLLNSLQGPLVRKETCSWSTTSVVEYFPVFPYADIISNWYSRQEVLAASDEVGVEQNHVAPPTAAVPEDNDRKKSQNIISVLNRLDAPFKMLHVVADHNRMTDSNAPEQIDAGQKMDICDRVTFIDCMEYNDQALGFEKQNNEAILNTLPSGFKLENCEGVHRAKEPVETVVYRKRNKSQKRYGPNEISGCDLRAVTECSKLEDKNVAVSCFPINMEVDGLVSVVACSVNVKSRSCSAEDHIADKMNRLTSPTPGAVKEEIVDGLRCIGEQNGENVSTEDKAVSSSQYRVHNHALVPFGSGPNGFDKIHEIVSSRGNLISQTALKVLHRKREMLCHQLRNIQDEIAVCDRNIQTILSGREDDLAVALDSIIECCNDVNPSLAVSAHEKTCQHLQDENSSEHQRRKRLCEANLSVQNPCQESDRMCSENGILPRVHVSTSEGGFQSKVIAKGTDFECSSVGAVCATPHEARESAAASVLVKLHGLGNS